MLVKSGNQFDRFSQKVFEYFLGIYDVKDLCFIIVDPSLSSFVTGMEGRITEERYPLSHNHKVQLRWTQKSLGREIKEDFYLTDFCSLINEGRIHMFVTHVDEIYPLHVTHVEKTPERQTKTSWMAKLSQAIFNQYLKR